MALGGILLGLTLAVPATTVLAGLLVGVPSKDPLVLAAVAATLLAVALLAAWLPARRASRIEPAVVLRG
jgi:ABC-type antimicrobial peptide transport system permease subunit